MVKPHYAQSNRGLIAATLTLPGFFRTLGFIAIIADADKRKRDVMGGLGQYLDISGVLPVPNNMTQIFVPETVRNEETAINWVKQTLQLLQG